jgi:large repetitive protein
MEQVSSVAAVLSGTPTVPGNYVFTLRLTDSNGNFMERTYTLAIMGITNTPPAPTQNTAYSFQFVAAGGTAPYTFTLEGALPVGLSMDSTGLISGTPTGTDTGNFTVTVIDSTP